MLEGESSCVVVDTGPDFRAQMLREGVKRLDAIVYTHEHKDHLAGMDDVRPFNYLQKSVMPLFASDRVEAALKSDFHYAFAQNKYPGVPNLNLHILDNEPFMVNDVQLTPIEVLHYKLPVFGYRIGNFSYVTDVNYINPAEKEKLKGSKVLVLSALRQSEHISHYSLAQAIAVAQEIGAEQTYFTHMSHQMGLHEEVNAQLPGGMQLAHDRLVIEV